MQTIENYINDRYDNNVKWFEEECKQGEHLHRISNVLNNKSYLKGVHSILNKENAKWKGQEYITKKLILQQAKTILNFHSTYLLGKELSLIGSERKVEEYEKIYRNFDYDNIDFKILDNALKFGDCFEYVYYDTEDKRIKSKIINTEDSYPVFSEYDGCYIAFIEHYTVNSSKISYYNIYYDDRVEMWNNKDGELHLIDTKTNLTGLPIHYHNGEDENYGRSMLEDIKPILNEFEDILSKMSDSIYCYSLNPLPVSVGQPIKGLIPADAVGYSISIDGGSFDFKNANMDYNTIQLYLNEIHKQLNITASMPSIIGGNTNVSNVSEVSLKLMYQLADVYAMLNEKWIKKGIKERFKKWDKILNMLCVEFNNREYVDIEFNYSRPINQSELLENLSKQRNMGAISIETVIEKSDLTKDKIQELARLKSENIGDKKEDIKTDGNKEFGITENDSGIKNKSVKYGK
ncbi:portal protein [Clostridium botulinum]|nr:phage portal protein [Clostridium botulinum]MBN3351848.1 portal protein [Clostridium botulinum]MBN3359451.1 portal protein [Clostridium botulinum]MBN3378135.1 portal protein [Clostridium botulinum]MBN3406284.1 portal protein [Clostridium botulinum]NFM83061.1 phage portal protein [Clostridium botulinum]